MARSSSRQILVFLAVMLCSLIHRGEPVNTSLHTETRLHDYLFDGYNPNVRPSTVGQNLIIYMDLYLTHVKLDEIQQTVEASMTCHFIWKDGLLDWNVTEYGGIKSIAVPSSKLWVPDVVNMNDLKDVNGMGFAGTRVKLFSDGTVVAWTHKNSMVKCRIHTKKFPFDKHHCELMFSSSLNEDTSVTLKSTKGAINLVWYKIVAEWEIIENSVAVGFFKSYGDIATNYSITGYKLTFQRRCVSCILNNLLALMLLSMLNLLTFLVPISSGEKLAFPMSIFLTVAVFLTAINGSLPEAIDGVSYIAVWVTLELGFCALTLLCTVCTLRLYHCMRDSKVPPAVLRLVSFFKRKTAANFANRQPFDKTEPAILKIDVGQTAGNPVESENSESAAHKDRNDNIEEFVEEDDTNWEVVCETMDKLMFVVFLCGQMLTTVIFVGLFLS